MDAHPRSSKRYPHHQVSTRDHFRFRDDNLCKRFLHQLYELREQGEYCDVTLRCGNVSVRCHRVVLSAASPYFQAMFSSGLTEAVTGEVQLQNMCEDTMRRLLTYMYTWEADITSDSVQGLVQACDLLHLPGLKAACQAFMLRHLMADNCVGMYRFASMYGLIDLAKGARHAMLTHFPEVVRGKEFPQLTDVELIDYVTDDRLQTANEDAVFDAVCRWASCDASSRREQVEEVLRHIRFPFCSSAYLCHVVSGHELMKCPLGNELLEEARKFHLLPEQRSTLTGVRVCPRLSFNWPEKLLSLGGATYDAKDNRCCWFLQERTGCWELLAQLPRPNLRQYHACAVPDGVVLSGGWQGTARGECWLFDTVEKRWLALGGLATPRFLHTSVALGEHVYVLGGQDDQQRLLASMETLVLRARCWEPASALPMPLSCPLAVACGHLLVVTGGTRNGGAASTATMTYDSVWGTWQQCAQMPCPCTDASAASLAGQMYVVGGIKPVCLQYDPTGDTWTELEPPQHPHSCGSTVAWRGSLLLAGGTADEGKPTTIIEQLHIKASQHARPQHFHSKQGAVEPSGHCRQQDENSKVHLQAEQLEAFRQLQHPVEEQKGYGSSKEETKGEISQVHSDALQAEPQLDEEVVNQGTQTEQRRRSHVPDHEEDIFRPTQRHVQPDLDASSQMHSWNDIIPVAADCMDDKDSVINEQGDMETKDDDGDNDSEAKCEQPQVFTWELFSTALRQPLHGHHLLVVDVCGL